MACTTALLLIFLFPSLTFSQASNPTQPAHTQHTLSLMYVSHPPVNTTFEQSRANNLPSHLPGCFFQTCLHGGIPRLDPAWKSAVREEMEPTRCPCRVHGSDPPTPAGLLPGSMDAG